MRVTVHFVKRGKLSYFTDKITVDAELIFVSHLINSYYIFQIIIIEGNISTTNLLLYQEKKN